MRRAPAPYYLSLLLLGACTSPKPQDCAPTTLMIGLVPSGTLFTGVPADFVTGIEYRGCNLDALGASATAQLLGPLNQPAPATVTVRTEPVNATDLVALTPQKVNPVVDAGVGDDTRLTLATVHFTAAAPGVYHLTVQFEPGLGDVQTDLEVVLDRRDAGFVTLAMPGPCVDFDLQAGVLLCLSGSQLLSVSDGGAVDSLPASAFAADGVDVWTATATDAGPELDLSRLDPSGAFTHVASVSLVGIETVTTPSLYARGERALVVLPPLLLEAWLDGGLQLGPVQSTLLSGPLAVSWSPGVGAIVGNDGRNGLSLCTVLFADGGFSCDTVTVVGSDGAAVWSQELTGVLTTWALGVDGGVVKDSALIGGGILFGDTTIGARLSGPLFRGATLGLLLDRFDVGLPVEAFSPPKRSEAPTSLGVSSTRYWQCTSNGVLDYVDR